MSTTPEIKEGDFKIKKKPKMKKLGKKNEITKVNLVEPKVEKEETVTKVIVPNEKKEEDAVQGAQGALQALSQDQGGPGRLCAAHEGHRRHRSRRHREDLLPQGEEDLLLFRKPSNPTECHGIPCSSMELHGSI